MKTSRPKKIHFAPGPSAHGVLCRTVTKSVTGSVVEVTCRRCMYRYLAAQAPWAEAFLNDLRGKPNLQRTWTEVARDQP